MKKIILFLILLIFIGMLLCGCYHKTYTDDNKTIYYHRFILIHEDIDPIEGNTKLAYDKNTKIVYLFVNRDMLSPYYIVIDEKPTIAIYGVNYEYQE